MKVEEQADRVIFSELSEGEWQIRYDWLQTEIINYEYWHGDHSKLVLHNPTPEQLETFNGLG